LPQTESANVSNVQRHARKRELRGVNLQGRQSLLSQRGEGAQSEAQLWALVRLRLDSAIFCGGVQSRTEGVSICTW
jgi:hypothetical protein